MKLVDTVWVTPDAEKHLLYMARVSSQKQNSSNPKLIRYLLDNKHFSPFEMISWAVEINTSRAISAQILRHRSFHFQEFSQRYAPLTDSMFVIYPARRQDDKNRQNSIDDMPEALQIEWELRQRDNWRKAFEHYQWALDQGIAKECARMVLPMQTATRMYMHGTVRDWIFYIIVRTDPTAQKEHRDVAELIRAQFVEEFPIISEGLGWL